MLTAATNEAATLFQKFAKIYGAFSKRLNRVHYKKNCNDVHKQELKSAAYVKTRKAADSYVC